MVFGRQTHALLAMALVAVVLAAVLTPLCTMTDCQQTAVGTCSDYQPACPDCPRQVAMKHTHDDALQAAAPAHFEFAALGTVASYQPPAVIHVVNAPDVTASPPPLDPLGVRLTL